VAQSESSEQQDKDAAAALAGELGVDVSYDFDREMGAYLARAVQDGQVIAQARGLSPQEALEGLRRAVGIAQRAGS
jgi:hypothetical protein